MGALHEGRPEDTQPHPGQMAVQKRATAALERVLARTTDGRRVSVFVKTLQSIRHWPMFETIPRDFRAAAVTRALTMIRTALRVLNIRTVGASRLPGPTFCLVGKEPWAERSEAQLG